MADEKKPEAKPAPEKDTFVEIVWFLLTVLIIFYVLSNLFSNLNSTGIFSRGWSALSPRGIMLAHTSPISSKLNPIGEKVVNLADTSVYDTPGGKKIGTQKVMAKGKILQGPVVINGERYWYVDYEDGPDGWVKESDIGYPESEPSLLEKAIIYLFLSFKYLMWLSVLVFILASIGIFKLLGKINNIYGVQKAMLYIENSKAEEQVNPHWNKIINLAESLNESDWRLSVLEADIMLSELLDKMSLPGDTLSDKLKSVERSDFLSIDDAWEAHKVRNKIAHEKDFVLTQREAKRVITLYENVFREFQII